MELAARFGLPADWIDLDVRSARDFAGAYAENQQICRIFAREQGFKVYDVNAGIGSYVAIEEGLAYPGSTFVGTDSHLNILGAVGAFGQGMGDQDIAFTFKAGKTGFEVPPSTGGVKMSEKTKKPTKITGRLWVLNDPAGDLYEDIDTDMIFHNQYLHITDVDQMGQ